MSQQVIEVEGISRSELVKRGRRLEYFTIAYNTLEGVIAVVAGLIAGSIALVGFGFDSLIEVTSAFPWSGGYIPTQMNHDVNGLKLLRSGLSELVSAAGYIRDIRFNKVTRTARST